MLSAFDDVRAILERGAASARASLDRISIDGADKALVDALLPLITTPTEALEVLARALDQLDERIRALEP